MVTSFNNITINNSNNNINYKKNLLCTGCDNKFSNDIDFNFHIKVCVHLFMKNNDINIDNDKLYLLIQLLTLYNYFIPTRNINLIKIKNRNIIDKNVLKYCNDIDLYLNDNNSNLLDLLSNIFEINIDLLNIIVKLYMKFKSQLIINFRMY